MSAKTERKWLLKRWWGLGGWSQMAGFELGVKKWEAHRDWLLRHKYIEQDQRHPALFRITAAGRIFLEDRDG